MRTGRVVGGILAGGVAVATLAAPAGAGPPIERARFHDEWSEVIEDFCDVEGLSVLFELSEDVNLLLNTAGRDGMPHFVSHTDRTVSWTNLQTGKTWSFVGHMNERTIDVVDNGDGTVSVLLGGSGSWKNSAPDDALLLNDPGHYRFEILIDLNGTPDDLSDDIELDSRLVFGDTGRNDGEGRDPCEDFVTYTS